MRANKAVQLNDAGSIRSSRSQRNLIFFTHTRRDDHDLERTCGQYLQCLAGEMAGGFETGCLQHKAAAFKELKVGADTNHPTDIGHTLLLGPVLQTDHTSAALRHNVLAISGHPIHMPDPPTTFGNKPARELASELLPYLETVANLHYLLDWHVVNPERLKELRNIEDEAFNAMLKRVLEHL